MAGFTRTRVGEREYMLSVCSEGAAQVWPARKATMPSVRGMEGMGSAPHVSAEPSCPSETQASSRAAQPGLWDANGSLGMLNGAFLSLQRGEMRGRKEFWF